MFDWLVKIPGPDFLIGYIFLSAVCIVVGRKVARGSNDAYHFPDKNQLDPLFFAVLRGGWQAAIDITVMQLLQRNSIGFTDETGQKTLIVKNQASDLSPVEQVVYNYLLVPKSSTQFNGKDMQAAIENALQPVYQQLYNQRLLKTADEVFTGNLITYSLLVILAGLAIIKLYFGILYHKPIGFLLLLIPLVSLVLLFTLQPWRRITPRGDKYIKEVAKHFAWLKEELAGTTTSSSSAINYALTAAIFGVGIFALSEMYADYRAFAQNRLGLSNGFSDTSAYTGTSSDSSSGSDGGGGSGCGGCGGCGGGD